MIEVLNFLPRDVIGVAAHGKVSKSDYEETLTPLLKEAHDAGRKVRFLYQLGPDFKGYSAGAVWDDLRVGMRYLRLFDRCAVVSDAAWLKRSTHVASFIMPCPVRVFANDHVQDAVAWLESPTRPAGLEVKLHAEENVVVIEPKQALTVEDFTYLASVVDPWIESRGSLGGLVLHARKFPGWENIDAMRRHFRFVRGHQHKIRRLAVAAKGPVFEVLPKIAGRFIAPEVKTFDYDELDVAIQWASKSS